MNRIIEQRAKIAIIVAFVGVAFGVMVPLYTDEIGWRFQLSRMVQDGGLDRIIFEVCGSLGAEPPVFMWPVRLIGSASTALVAHPIAIRLIGIATALASFIALIAILRAVRPIADDDRRSITALSFGLLGLGLLPLLMMWSRPEQPIVLAMLLTVLTVLRGIEPARTVRQRWVATAIVFTLAIVAISLHVKVFYFLPLFFAALMLVMPPGSRLPLRAGVTLALLLVWVLSLKYWTARFACPADPVIARQFGAENLASAILSGRIPEKGILGTLGDMLPFGYVHPIIPGPRLMSDWLPPLDLWPPVAVAFKIIVWLSVVSSLVLLTRSVRGRLNREVPAPVILAGALLLGIAACTFTQLRKNAYEAALVMPLLILIIILVLGSDRRHIGGLKRLSILIVTVATCGQLFLIPYLTPRLARSQAAAGVIETQKRSIPVFSYGAIGERVRAAARQCRIPLDGSARYVGIDDMSYLIFADSWRPMYRFGMNGAWSYDVPDAIGLLRERRSSGMVVQCRELKPELRARATVVGDFCCLGAQ